jgi:hypothetical protein
MTPMEHFPAPHSQHSTSHINVTSLGVKCSSHLLRGVGLKSRKEQDLEFMQEWQIFYSPFCHYD